MRTNWLQGREDNEEWPGVIYEIDLSVNLPYAVQKPVIFKSSYLRDRLDIVDERGRLYQYSIHEFLILYKVPAKCIVRTYGSPDEFFAATVGVPPFHSPYQLVFLDDNEEHVNSETTTLVTCSHHEVLTNVL